MDNRAEVKEFLSTRRAKVSARRAGLPDVGARRVPGLRRSEVAALAGISVEYYAKLERDALAGASASVLDALARALQLDDAEAHALVRPRPGRRRHQRPAAASPHVYALGAAPEPAVGPGRHHRRSSHRPQRPHGPPGHQRPRAGHALVAVRERPRNRTAPPNFARYTFLDSDSSRFYPDWHLAADTCVAILRTEAGRDPHDKAPHDLVGELCTRSEDFSRRWSSHDVRLHGAGTKTFHHRVVGDLELAYESMDMISEPGLTLTLYTAQPGHRPRRASPFWRPGRLLRTTQRRAVEAGSRGRSTQRVPMSRVLYDIRPRRVRRLAAATLAPAASPPAAEVDAALRASCWRSTCRRLGSQASGSDRVRPAWPERLVSRPVGPGDHGGRAPWE